MGEDEIRQQLRSAAERFLQLTDCLGKPSVHDRDAWAAWNHVNSTGLFEWIEKAPLTEWRFQAHEALLFEHEATGRAKERADIVRWLAHRESYGEASAIAKDIEAGKHLEAFMSSSGIGEVKP